MGPLFVPDAHFAKRVQVIAWKKLCGLVCTVLHSLDVTG